MEIVGLDLHFILHVVNYVLEHDKMLAIDEQKFQSQIPIIQLLWVKFNVELST